MNLISSLRCCAILGIGLGSCSNANKQLAVAPPNPAQARQNVAPVRSPANTSTHAPRVRGPVPRNPDVHLPSARSTSGKISFSSVPMQARYVAMTFDDGPHAQNTPRLLDILRARNIKATFYVVGKNAELYPGIIRQMIAEGHEIGSHTYDHPNLAKLSDDAIRSQLNRTRDAVVRAAGVAPRTLRPPYGSMTTRQREWVHSEYNYPIIMWSVDPYDWKRPGSSVVASRILAATQPGGIILSHDIHKSTIDAMPAALDGLLKKGYRFVKVSQLLALQAAPPAPDTVAAKIVSGQEPPTE